MAALTNWRDSGDDGLTTVTKSPHKQTAASYTCDCLSNVQQQQ